MSQYDETMNKKAVALRYEENKDAAPVIVASGMGYVAEKIVEIANDNGAFRYMKIILLRQSSRRWNLEKDPPELYQAVVDIYAYFLDLRKRIQKRIEGKKIQNNEEEDVSRP